MGLGASSMDPPQAGSGVLGSSEVWKACVLSGLIGGLVILVIAVFSDVLKGQRGDRGKRGKSGKRGRSGSHGDDGHHGDHGCDGQSWCPIVRAGPPTDWIFNNLIDGTVYIDSLTSNLWVFQSTDCGTSCGGNGTWVFVFRIGIPAIIEGDHITTGTWQFAGIAYTPVELADSGALVNLTAGNPTSYLRLDTSSVLTVLHGVAQPSVDGFIMNVAVINGNFSVANESATDPTASNRIIIGGGFVTMSSIGNNDSAFTLQYDTSASRWRVIFSVGMTFA